MNTEDLLLKAKKEVNDFIEAKYMEYKGQINTGYCKNRYREVKTMLENPLMRIFPIVLSKDILESVKQKSTCKKQCFDCMADVGEVIKRKKKSDECV